MKRLACAALLLVIVAGFWGSRLWRAGERPVSNPHLVSRQEAIEIANAHFGRNPNSGCYVRETDKHYVISPPYKLQRDIDAAAVYVEKTTGRLRE